MDSSFLLIFFALVAFILTIINPFYILPVFIVGSLTEPAQYFPHLIQYNPTFIIGISVLAGWLLRVIMSGGFESAQSKQVVMFWFFLLWLLLSTLIYMDTSWWIFKFYIRSFIPYLLFLYIIKTRQQISIVIWMFVILGFIAGLYGIYCLKANIGISDRGIKRISSFFANPNAFGATMTLIVPLAIGLLYYNYERFNKALKIFLFGALALIVTGVIISYSRKCFFALSGAILLTPYKLSKPGKKIAAIILTVILTLSSAYFFPDQVKWRLWSRVTTVFEAESMEDLDLGRAETNKAGYVMMLENPLFGVGLDGFKSEYIDITLDPTSNIQLVGEEGLGAHNLYVQVGASIGLIGLLFYLLMIIFAFRDAKIAEKNFIMLNDDYLRIISVSYQIFIIVFLFIGIFSGVLTSKIFWMILPLSSVLKKISIYEKTPTRESDTQEM